MKRERVVDVDRLMGDVAYGMANGFGPRDLVPMLEKLVKAAPTPSDAARFAKLHLAELLVTIQPWRAAVLAREVARERACDRAERVLGMALMTMAHFKAALGALRRARELAPHDPSHAHNLGHLLDAGLDRPLDALHHLRAALRAAPGEPEIASSLAHALARSGERGQARALLQAHLRLTRREAEQLVARWLHEAGELVATPS
jgi:cytochrome c-type biogenesis protein CcmH/NrfG